MDNEEILLTIDYGQSLEQMIAVGKYDFINGSITEKEFPVMTELLGKIVDISVRPFCFGRYCFYKNAISKMDKSGYRSATLAEILAIGVKYPEMQRQFPIIALGSFWVSPSLRRYTPYLYVRGGKRILDFECLDYHSLDYSRFIGIVK